MRRPHSFSDIKGHTQLIQYFQKRLETDTMPKFIILHGGEGLGKTSIADLLAIELIYGDHPEDKAQAIQEIIDEDKSNQSIKKYKMSVEGGKEAAKEVLDDFTASMTPYGKKVIICDECHGLSSAAQDVFLKDTEYLPKGVYLIMLTTEIQELKPTLLSRAVTFHLHDLSQKEMVEVLEREVSENNLNIQGGRATLEVIAEWADFKPRKALSLLSAFSKGESISTNVIYEFVGYQDVNDIIPVIKYLNGSVVNGLEWIRSMDISDSVLNISIDILRVVAGHHSKKFRVADVQRIRSELSEVPINNIIEFIRCLAGQKVTRRALISAFLNAHVTAKQLAKLSQDEVLNVEHQQIATAAPIDQGNASSSQKIKAPSLDDIFLNSKVVKE